jgi:hypothetical protein
MEDGRRTNRDNRRQQYHDRQKKPPVEPPPKAMIDITQFAQNMRQAEGRERHRICRERREHGEGGKGEHADDAADVETAA